MRYKSMDTTAGYIEAGLAWTKSGLRVSSSVDVSGYVLTCADVPSRERPHDRRGAQAAEANRAAFEGFMRDVLTPREIESLDDLELANEEMNAATKAWFLARSPALSAESEAALSADELRFYRLAKNRLS